MNLGTIFTGLGYVTGAVVFWYVARRQKLDSRTTFILMAIGFSAGVLGARVVQSLVQGQPQAAFDPNSGGRAVLAGVFIGWLAVEGVKKILGVTSSTGRAFALALPAGEAVGRIGCFFNGCCYGTPSALPWSVHQHGALRHPAQIYAALASVIVLALVAAYARREESDRNVFLFYLVCWGVTRLIVEVFRAHDILWFGLGAMQIAAIETALLSAVLLTVNRLKAKAV